MAALTHRPPRKKVAIVGSGCSGIGALWALNRTHHDVYIYEAADRLGGHTNTVEFRKGKYTTAVDTGFIVLNTATYPNLINFFKAVGVETVPTDMTFGVSRDYGLFEWAGTSLGAVFAQKRNIFSLRMWRMIFDIIRFNQFALDLLADEDKQKPYVNGVGAENGNGYHETERLESIGEYLEREGYSDAFRDDYLIPMAACVWSTGPDKCSLEFPAVTLVRFLWNHHLLTTIGARAPWLTPKNGSKSYIDAVMKGFPPNHVFLNTAVKSITNHPSGRVLLHLENGRTDTYDHVILATHGDQALQIISASATPAEISILSAFQTSKNTAVLHNDLSLMPRSRKTWAAWNYMTLSKPTATTISSSSSSSSSTTITKSSPQPIDRVCLTYNMNILQHIPTSIFGDVLVTLNPLHPPASSTSTSSTSTGSSSSSSISSSSPSIHSTYTYAHPLYTSRAIHAQALLYQIQNTRGISYSGAWTKYGFHEDGFSSGLRVAMDHLGAELPFSFVDSTFSRGGERGGEKGRPPALGARGWALRVVILLVRLWIVVLERLWGLARGTAVGEVVLGDGGVRSRVMTMVRQRRKKLV